jgi:aminoglycoside phosphotransferase (APT) family kinase protein
VLRPDGGLPRGIGVDAPVWRQLAEAGVPAAAPVAQAPDGAVLWRWLPGRPRRFGSGTGRAAALGRLLARLHGVRDGEGRPLRHGDPSPGNVLWRSAPDRPGLVDWEAAAFGEPALDLVTVWASVPLAHVPPSAPAAAVDGAWAWCAAVADGYRAAGGTAPSRAALHRAVAAQLSLGEAWVRQLPERRRRRGAAWLCSLERAAADPATRQRLCALWRADGR